MWSPVTAMSFAGPALRVLRSVAEMAVVAFQKQRAFREDGRGVKVFVLA